jgi:hypothetical protein
MTWWSHLVHWLEVHTGTVNEPGPYYGFFSGFGSDLGEVALIGGLITFVRHANCGAPGCWRLGKHPTADNIHRLCRHHHPELMGHKPTIEEIHQAHNEAKGTP